MRIQHNISAMNSYRNFAGNTSKLSKNLEKLSTGYKINRAGDDAAGLAISEKMRAQITGLEGATKNAKDGISLIQTAEGALTEVHDMLNRMVTLTEQSANGTYDNELDRDQLQKEVSQLKDEINRIADSTNYNGIKLLDGSLSGGGNLKGNLTTSDIEATKGIAMSTKLANVNNGDVTTTKQDGTAGTDLEEGDKVSFTVSWKDKDNKEYSSTVEFTIGSKNGATDGNSALIAADGTKYNLAAKNTIDKAALQDAVINELNKNDAIKANFTATKGSDVPATVTNSSGSDWRDGDSIALTSKTAGTSGAVVTGMELSFHEKQGDGTFKTTKLSDGSDVNSRYNATDDAQQLNLKNLRVLNSNDASATDGRVAQNTFEVGGKKFVLYSGSQDGDIDQITNKFTEKVGSDVTVIQLNGANSAAADGQTYLVGTSSGANSYETDAKTIAGELKRLTGMDFKAQQVNDGAADNWQVVLTGSTKLTTGGKSLDIQIGDTSDDFNKLSVAVKDMHTDAMGIKDVDISTQEGAAAAMDTIKQAVNYVSDVRGTLGALQNRLDHTINNLGVMRENIQSAESLIRDTDVAEEMMTYTKNNILNQSAQAMLAQANQLPQGVLQLLG